MANPLFNLLGNNQQNGMQSQFDSFKRTVQGDPQAIVNQLVSSGKMSQEQFNDLYTKAQALRGVLK